MKALLIFVVCFTVITVEFATALRLSFDDIEINPTSKIGGHYEIEEYTQTLAKRTVAPLTMRMNRTTEMKATLRPHNVLTRLSNTKERLDHTTMKPKYSVVRQCDFDDGLIADLKYFLSANDGDEGGHVLAATIGGLCNEHNLMLQAGDINRDLRGYYMNRGSGWYKNEEVIRSFLKNSNNRYVDYEVWLEYATNSGRPSTVKYKTVYYEDGLPICIECNSLTNDNKNPVRDNQPHRMKTHADCARILYPAVSQSQEVPTYNQHLCTTLTTTDNFH